MPKPISNGKVCEKVRTKMRSVKINHGTKLKKEYKRVQKEMNPCKILVLFVILSSAIPCSIYAYNYYEENVRIKPISEQLQVHYNEIQKFLIDATKDIAILEADPLLNIIRDGLASVRDRISSIRSHTQGYEDMPNKIKGGPTHFIESSITELNDIRAQVFAQLDEKVRETVIVYATLRRKWTPENIKDRWFTVLLADKLDDLQKEGIFFVPQGDNQDQGQEDEVEEEIPKEVAHRLRDDDFINSPGPLNETVEALAQIGDIFSQLSQHFLEREKIEEEILNLAHPYRYLFLRPSMAEVTTLLDEAYDNYHVDEALGKFVHSNSTLLSSLVTKHSVIDRRISRIVAKFGPSHMEYLLPRVLQLNTRMSVLEESIANRKDGLETAGYMIFRKEIEADVDNLIQRLYALKGTRLPDN